MMDARAGAAGAVLQLANMLLQACSIAAGVRRGSCPA
jgi:hypothetical protein